MEKLLLKCIFLGHLTVTAYRGVPEQTKPTGYDWTSIGDRTTQYGCAVSQDLLKSGLVQYGDILYINEEGFRVVNDCMHERMRNHIDLFVLSYKEEKRIGYSRKSVWLIKRQGVITWQDQRKDLSSIKSWVSKKLIPIILGSVVLIGIGLVILKLS